MYKDADPSESQLVGFIADCHLNDIVMITALRVLTRVGHDYHTMQSREGFPVAWPKQPHTLQSWLRNV